VRRLIFESIWREETTAGLFGDCPVKSMTPQLVKVLRDRKVDAPEAANSRIKALRAVLGWAQTNAIGYVSTNAANDVAYFAAEGDGHHSWTRQEFSQFEQSHPLGTKARLALALLYYTGARRGDLVTLGRQHVHDGWLSFTTKKTGTRVDLPVHPEMQVIIDASPTGDLTFLVNELNRPFTAAGFGNWFRERCDEADLKHCSAHGVRKGAATIAAEDGATTRELMARFGWLREKEAEHYTRAADRKRLAASGMSKLKPRT